MTDNLHVAMRETVKQALRHSQHPRYVEPALQDERGQVVSPRQEPVDAFLGQLEQWGYVVVSIHEARIQKADANG